MFTTVLLSVDCCCWSYNVTRDSVARNSSEYSGLVRMYDFYDSWLRTNRLTPLSLQTDRLLTSRPSKKHSPDHPGHQSTWHLLRLFALGRVLQQVTCLLPRFRETRNLCHWTYTRPFRLTKPHNSPLSEKVVIDRASRSWQRREDPRRSKRGKEKNSYRERTWHQICTSLLFLGRIDLMLRIPRLALRLKRRSLSPKKPDGSRRESLSKGSFPRRFTSSSCHKSMPRYIFFFTLTISPVSCNCSLCLYRTHLWRCNIKGGIEIKVWLTTTLTLQEYKGAVRKSL